MEVGPPSRHRGDDCVRTPGRRRVPMGLVLRSSRVVSRAAVVVAAVVGMVGMVGMVAAPALAAEASPELSVSVQQVEPGDAVEVSGTGFVMPEPTVCEVRWNGPPLPGTQCYIDGGVFGLLVVDESVPPGRYTVTVCVPGCDHPWAGEQTAGLRVAAVPGSTSDTDPPSEVGLTGPELAMTRSTALVVPAVAVTSTGLVLDPPVTVAGENVNVSTETLPGDFSGTPDCQLTWDGVPAGGCSADATGSLTGRLVVPDDATGGDHEVAACRPRCSDAVGGQDVSEVQVTTVEPSDEATDEVPTTVEPPATATAEPPGSEPPAPASAEPSAPATTTAEPPAPATGPPSASSSAPPTSVPPDIGAAEPSLQSSRPAVPALVLVVVVALLLVAAVAAMQTHQPNLTRATPGLRARLDLDPQVQVDELAAVARAPAFRLRRLQDMKPTILAEVHDDRTT